MISELSTFHGWAHLGAGVGVILSLWALLTRLDKALLSHLAPSFADRKRFERLESKVDKIDAKLDTLIEINWRRKAGREE